MNPKCSEPSGRQQLGPQQQQQQQQQQQPGPELQQPPPGPRQQQGAEGQPHVPPKAIPPEVNQGCAWPNQKGSAAA